MMSSFDDAFSSASAPSAVRVGADLRAARERLGWTLEDVASHLRIRRPFLEAMEEGRTADLPGNAYAIGFLRTYASALGLDPDEIGRRFRAEAAEANRKTELKFLAPVPERGIPAGAIVLVGGLIAIGAYIGWYRMSGSSHTATEIVQTVPERLAPLAAKPVQPAPAPAPAAPAAAHMADAPLPPMPVVSPSSAAAAVAPGGLAAAASPAPVVAAIAFGPPAPGSSAPPPAAPPASAAVALANPVPALPVADAARPEGARIVLRAKSDAWMQVRDKTGQVLLNRVLRAGETWPLPAKSAVLLTTGNAAGTEVVIDGVASGPLGGDGVVRRDIPLDTDAIKDGRLAPPPKKS